jgi:hypothetical protein
MLIEPFTKVLGDTYITMALCATDYIYCVIAHGLTLFETKKGSIKLPFVVAGAGLEPTTFGL